MELTDRESGIVIDDAFPCSSAGGMRRVEDGRFEIDYKPEAIPGWFQDLLNELFDGAGVPKEYMAHVRVANRGRVPRRPTLRFLLSPRGRNYMFPPWWLHRGDAWAWVPAEDIDMRFEAGYVDVTVLLGPGETVRVASAPYETPEAVCERARQLADRSGLFQYREIGQSAQGRPIPLLETAPRPLKLMVDATMQSCEPVSWGVMHVAHWLTIPTARAQGLLDRVQFALLPMTNPDGVVAGRSVTNARGEVPKFGINDLVSGARPAPMETRALWDYLTTLRPDACIEVHAHFTREGFTRSIGMHDRASMPEALQAKAAVIEAALEANYHAAPLENRKVLIDPRRPEHNVYGDRHVSEQAGAIRTFLQAVPDSLEAHAADVREMVETVARALIAWVDD